MDVTTLQVTCGQQANFDTKLDALPAATDPCPSTFWLDVRGLHALAPAAGATTALEVFAVPSSTPMTEAECMATPAYLQMLVPDATQPSGWADSQSWFLQGQWTSGSGALQAACYYNGMLSLDPASATSGPDQLRFGDASFVGPIAIGAQTVTLRTSAEVVAACVPG